MSSGACGGLFTVWADLWIGFSGGKVAIFKDVVGDSPIARRLEVAENPITGERMPTNTAYLVYVAVDNAGNPTPIPPLLAETEAEKRRAVEARERQERRLKQK